jgi:hypothetical protein
MTLHISAIMQGHAIQVSDRLATTTARGGTRAFNPAMNKNVVYQATDALVSIGVSGRAYLEGIPSDRWVAEKLSGQDLSDGALTLRAGGPPDKDLYHAVEDIRTGAEAAFRRLGRLDRRVEQSFAIVGWQRRRRARAQPIVWVVRNSPLAPETFVVERELQERDTWGRSVLTMRPTGMLLCDELERTFEELGRTRSAGQAEGCLVDGVRRVAAQHAGVGKDCMVIWIRPNADPQIAIRFLPHEDLRARVLRDGTEAPVVFTPWILTRGGAIFASNFIAGTAGVWAAGGIRWIIHSPEFANAGRVGMLMDRWPTPRDPQLPRTS